MQEPDLRGKTALVTGGGRGIGQATAVALARCGAEVVVVARGAAALDDVVREIRAMGGDAQAFAADISDAEAVRALFQSVGPVDILVNNAGIIGPIVQIVDAAPEEWNRNIEINLFGVFLTTRYVLPAMLERGWGRIVNVSSGAARGTTAGWGAYSAAKAGVEAFTSVTAREVAGRGVCVNAVRPGIVDTEMQVEIRGSTEAQFGVDNLQRFRGFKERGVLRPPEDPARLILWCLSAEADSVSGEVLAIDDPDVAARIGLQAMGR